MCNTVPAFFSRRCLGNACALASSALSRLGDDRSRYWLGCAHLGARHWFFYAEQLSGTRCYTPAIIRRNEWRRTAGEVRANVRSKSARSGRPNCWDRNAGRSEVERVESSRRKRSPAPKNTKAYGARANDKDSRTMEKTDRVVGYRKMGYL